jgi:hypothetical protein
MTADTCGEGRLAVASSGPLSGLRVGAWVLSRREIPVITSADLSPAQELVGRIHRYTLTMAVRLAFLLIAVASRGTPLMWVAIVGAIVLPWIAVLAANNRRSRRCGKLTTEPAAAKPEPELTAPPFVIDADPQYK